MAIPELERHCGSWIATSPTGGVREFYLRSNAEKADAAGWRVETAAQYLGRVNSEIRKVTDLRSERSPTMSEPTPVIDCTKCGDELTQKKRPLCQGCVDDACADVEIDCGICGRHRAECCYECGSAGAAGKAREYAVRRKALGFMTPEVFAAFELFADDLEAGDAS